MTAIRDSESLMSWEITENCNGEAYFKSVNSNKLSAFRWPFFAYATDQKTFVLNDLSKGQLMVHHELELSDEDLNGNIDKMEFTEDGNLYVLFITD